MQRKSTKDLITLVGLLDFCFLTAYVFEDHTMPPHVPVGPDAPSVPASFPSSSSSTSAPESPGSRLTLRPARLNTRYPTERLRKRVLASFAGIAVFGLLVGSCLFTVFLITESKQQSLQRPLELDTTSVMEAKKTWAQKFDSIGVIKSSVVARNYFPRLLNVLDNGRIGLLEMAMPLIAFLISKTFSAILQDFLEVRYSDEEGVNMTRLLTFKCATDFRYAFFGDRMPKFWKRANPLQLDTESNSGIREALGDDFHQNRVSRWRSRMSDVKVALFVGLGFNAASLLVDLAANYGSAGIFKYVDPVGGRSNFTLELTPKYTPILNDPAEFVGLRKCTPFRVQVEGVVGGSKEVANAFMACGTYYEVTAGGASSEKDGRNICSWATNANPKNPNGQSYRWKGIEVYTGNSACEKKGIPPRGNLNIRFKLRKYGLIDETSEGPNTKETESVIVGVSLTSTPLTGIRKFDPQVSFSQTAVGEDEASDSFATLAKSIAEVVERFNDPNIYEEQRAIGLDILLKRDQIPDSAVIELTEAIAQNIFFSSTYGFVRRETSYCIERPGECQDTSKHGIHMGIHNTRRAFLVGELGGLFFLLLAKILLWYGTRRFYFREISTVFDDAVFSSLSCQSALDYTQVSDTRVSRGWTLLFDGSRRVLHYQVYDSADPPAGVEDTVAALLDISDPASKYIVFLLPIGVHD